MLSGAILTKPSTFDQQQLAALLADSEQRGALHTVAQPEMSDRVDGLRETFVAIWEDADPGTTVGGRLFAPAEQSTTR